MKPLLDFDDAGASDDEPAKGVTVGDIRAWHDELEAEKARYDSMLTLWAECRQLLSEERLVAAGLREDIARREAHDRSKNLMPIQCGAGEMYSRLADPNGNG